MEKVTEEKPITASKKTDYQEQLNSCKRKTFAKPIVS